MAISLKENMLRVMQHKEPDYLPMRSDFIVGFSSACNEAGTGTKEAPISNDWFGRKWVFEHNIGGSAPDANFRIIEDITEWESVIKFPDLSQIDWEAAATKDTANWNRENKMVRYISGSGPWEQLYESIDFVEALCALEEEPEACYEFFSAFADYKIRLHDYAIKHYKPDIITMHDDYGSAQGLFMSPNTWRKLLKPHLKKIVEHCQANGVIYQHHCCGYMASLIEEMADDLGVTSWQLIHPSNNPAELYKKIGKKVSLIDGLLDNAKIDTENITEEEIRNIVREAVDAICPGGAPVVISASTVKSFPERQAIVDDELLKYAQKYYKEPRPV